MIHPPLRIRLTAIFATAMGAVLAAAGWQALTRLAETQREYPATDPAAARAAAEAYADLRSELLIGLPVIFLLATAGAYLLAGAALHPVERMRRQAAAITDTTPQLRLDVPPSRDEIARLATTLNDLLTRLHTSLEREKRFVADASHDLRTPLSLLTTELDLALRRPRSHTELHAALTSARHETHHLVALAEDLLLLARTDQTDPTSGHDGHTTVPLAQLLHDIAGRHPDTTTHITCPDDLTAPGNPARLDRAITNMLTNAIQHGADPIHITARPDNDSVRITVRDHGTGFLTDFLPHAFDRLTRADPTRSRGGTGLGLVIVAAITRATGGTHGAANHPDGGAETWIKIPATPTPRPHLHEDRTHGTALPR